MISARSRAPVGVPTSSVTTRRLPCVLALRRMLLTKLRLP